MDNEDIKKVNNDDPQEINLFEDISAAEKPAPEEITPTREAPVITSSATQDEKANAFDEIMNSMYELSELYGGEESARARKIREQDERRREQEMAAKREDIERRYSQHVEEARSNMESAMGTKPVSDNSQAQSSSEEISNLHDLIDVNAIREAPAKLSRKTQKPEKPKKAKKIKKKKLVEYIDLDEKNAVYRGIYSLGDTVLRGLEVILGTLIHFISIPLSAIVKLVRKSTQGTKNNISNRARIIVWELLDFAADIRDIGKNSRAERATSGRSIIKILLDNTGKAFKSNSRILKSIANTLLPIGSVIVLLFVFNYWNHVTFALNVIYNDESIGYITDESVLIEARDLVVDRLAIASRGDKKTEATVSVNSIDAGYELALVSLSELSDARTISDRMIENSVENLTMACGIYINDELICAVKNEADAKTVFYNILEPYEEDAKVNGYVVNFDESIDYVQGLYPDEPSVMWDASQLEDYVLGVDEATGEKTINIRKTITTSKIEEVPYRIVKQRDITKYSGYRMITQKGAAGTQRVITTTTFVNDVNQGSVSRAEIIIEAIDEVVVVGTRTTYGGVYIGEASDYGFLWPAPNCHYISSPYGWRSSGWHKGIDLCTTNGTAFGSPVIASKGGTVEVVQRSDSGYGHMVLINHGDGYKTRYAHMIAGSITVRVGDVVEAGQTIGKVGSTGNSSGPHLHFEVIYNGDTYDPKSFIN